MALPAAAIAAALEHAGVSADAVDEVIMGCVLPAGLGQAPARQAARESDDFRRTIIRHEQLVLAQAQQSAACNASHSLNERLARWLLHTRDVLGADSLLLTQEFMAEMLGVRRTSVSIVAHGLQQAGLISYRRGHVKIENAGALQSSACECYAAVRMRYSTPKTSALEASPL